MHVTSLGLPRLVRGARVDSEEPADPRLRDDAGNGVNRNTELTEEDVRRIGRRAGDELRALIRTGGTRHAG